MVHLNCDKCGNIMTSNQPVNLMAFIDFTLMPDGKIKISRVWTTPKKESVNQIYRKPKKMISKFEGVKKSGRREL